METSESTPIRTVRLNSRQEQELLDRMDNVGDGAAPGASRRTDPRAKYRPQSPVVVHVHQPNGSEVRFTVLPRNLSAGGFGFLHGQFIHFPGKCAVLLPTLDGEMLSVRGTINGCRHVSGLIHDVSVVFSQHIDATLFVDQTALKKPDGEQDPRSTKPAGPADAVMRGKHVILLGTAGAAKLATAAMQGAQPKAIASKDVPALLAALRSQIEQGLVVYEVQPGQAG